MTIIPPERAPTAYAPEPLLFRGNADGAGALSLATQPVPGDRRWLISYVVLTATATSPAVAAVTLFTDTTDPYNLWDGADDASGAIAEYATPRRLIAGQILIAQFSGADPGGACSMRIEYDVARV